VLAQVAAKNVADPFYGTLYISLSTVSVTAAYK